MITNDDDNDDDDDDDEKWYYLAVKNFLSYFAKITSKYDGDSLFI